VRTRPRRRARLARYHEANPTTETYVLAGVGVVLFAGLAYWLYSQASTNSATSSGGGGGGTSGGSSTYSNITGTSNPATPDVTPSSAPASTSSSNSDFWSAGNPGGSFVQWATGGLAQPEGSPLS
jgi:hypothetical protein